MDANEIIDLYTSVVVVGTEKQLVNRLDSGIDAVKATADTPRRLVGLQGTTANTGYIIGRVEQLPVVTIDMALLTALDQVVPMDIPLAAGQELKFYAQSAVGTAAVTIVAHVQKG